MTRNQGNNLHKHGETPAPSYESPQPKNKDHKRVQNKMITFKSCHDAEEGSPVTNTANINANAINILLHVDNSNNVQHNSYITIRQKIITSVVRTP